MHFTAQDFTEAAQILIAEIIGALLGIGAAQLI